MQATCNTIYKNRNGPVFSHLIILLAKQLTAIQKPMISYEQKEWEYNSKKGAGGNAQIFTTLLCTHRKVCGGSGQWVKELGSSL